MAQDDDSDFLDEAEYDDEGDGRRSFLRLSRDKILLVSAIVLFTLAIGLTVLFSSNPDGSATGPATPEQGGEPATVTGTLVSALTPSPGKAYPAAGYPAPQQPSAPAAGSAPTATFGDPGSAGGLATAAPPLPPGLDVTPGQTPGGTYTAPDSPQGLGTPLAQPTASVPVFDPNRPPTPDLAGGSSQFPTSPQATIDPSSFDNPQQGSAATSTAGQAGDTPQASATAQANESPFPTQPPPPTEAPPPTELPVPTPQPLPPTPQPQPTAAPRPTATRIPPTPIPAPTAIPVDVLSGSVRWSIDRSPIILTRDQQLTAGSVLVIDPGVEVRMAPGVRFFVEGSLVAAGAPGNPVRFMGTGPGQRWEALYGRPGGKILIDNAEIRGGGSGGRAIVSQGGELVLKSTLVTDNGGGIQANDSRLELQRNEISGNDVPYGASVDATYSRGGFAILADNRIGGNRVSDGASSVRIEGASPIDTIVMDVQRNLILGGTPDSPALEVFSSGQLQGPLICNTFQQGSVGVALHSDRKQVPGFALQVRNNSLLDNTPPIEPIYLQYGIGRGATSDIAVDMSQNWWGDKSGPYHPEQNPEGRGDSVGPNITFGPWLTSRPDCAPQK